MFKVFAMVELLISNGCLKERRVINAHLIREAIKEIKVIFLPRTIRVIIGLDLFGMVMELS